MDCTILSADNFVSYQPAFARAQGLPLEVLAQVFHYALTEDDSIILPPETKTWASHPTLIFARVCRRWKHSVMITGVLWSSFSMKMDKESWSASHFAKFLQLSKGHPLSVRVQGLSAHSPPVIIHAILLESKRISFLSLETANAQNDHLVDLFLTRHHLPALRELAIMYSGADTDSSWDFLPTPAYNGDRPHTVDIPRFRSLTLNQVPFYVLKDAAAEDDEKPRVRVPWSLPLHQIKEVNLTYMRVEPLFYIMSKALFIERIHVDQLWLDWDDIEIFSPDRGAPILLEHLTHLDIHIDDDSSDIIESDVPHDMIPFSSFRAPNVSTLLLNPCRFGYLKGIMPLGLGPELSELSLLGFDPIAENDFVSLLSLLNAGPPLKRFTLHWADSFDDRYDGYAQGHEWSELDQRWAAHEQILRALLAKGGKSPAFPELVSIQLLNIPHDIELTRLLQRVLRVYVNSGGLERVAITFNCEEEWEYMEIKHLNPEATCTRSLSQIEEEYVVSQLEGWESLARYVGKLLKHKITISVRWGARTCGNARLEDICSVIDLVDEMSGL